MLSSTVTLPEGQHFIELRYFENQGDQTLRFDIYETEAEPETGEELMWLLSEAGPDKSDTDPYVVSDETFAGEDGVDYWGDV